MMRRAFAATALLFALSGFAASGARAADATGIWMTEGSKARVRVAPCGNAICGTVIWLREANGADGLPKRDEKNEDATKQSRPLLGSAVLLSMSPDGETRWKGRIYNAEDGKTYSASFTITGPSSARLEGCVAAIFCKSQVWTRN